VQEMERQYFMLSRSVISEGIDKRAYLRLSGGCFCVRLVVCHLQGCKYTK
jgi:hypothetical protein